MSLSFKVVDVPKVSTGRQAAPNPYTEAVEAIMAQERGKAVQFQPIGEHTFQMVGRRLRAAAPENVTIRTRFDAESNTVTAWATDKKRSAVTPEAVAAKVAKNETAPKSAPTKSAGKDAAK